MDIVRTSCPELHFACQHIPPELIPPFHKLVRLYRKQLLGRHHRLLPETLRQLVHHVNRLPDLLFKQFEIPANLCPANHILFRNTGAKTIFSQPCQERPDLFSSIQTTRLFEGVQHTGIIKTGNDTTAVISGHHAQKRIFLFGHHLPIGRFGRHLHRLLLNQRCGRRIII